MLFALARDHCYLACPHDHWKNIVNEQMRDLIRERAAMPDFVFGWRSRTPVPASKKVHLVARTLSREYLFILSRSAEWHSSKPPIHSLLLKSTSLHLFFFATMAAGNDLFKLYRYDPSMTAAVIFIILFSAISALHTYQLVRTKTWFFIPFLIGGYCEMDELDLRFYRSSTNIVIL